MELNGKAALITGGTMGIGAAIGVELARRGADVALVARSEGDEARETLARIQQTGRRSELILGDVEDAEFCQRCVDQTAERFGRLDVLIHNAGGPSWGRIEDVSPEQWRRTMAIHVDANYFLCRAAIPHLRRQKEGAIITLSSVAGLRGVPNAIAYATAKGAVAQFTRALARDLADDNIRVNGVAPGVIRTRFHQDMPADRAQYNIEHRIPLHREGTPEQVADVVAMLVTNDYITGETIVVDAGLTMRIV